MGQIRLLGAQGRSGWEWNLKMILSPSESEGLRFLLKIWIWAPTGPSRLRLLAIGPQLASRVPIQVDEDDDSEEPWGAPGAPPGPPWPS